MAGILPLTGCRNGLLTQKIPEEERLDRPLNNLSPEEFAQFQRGDEAFGHIFSPAEGLGPLFNDQGCESCHPADGRGDPVRGLIRFGRYLPDGRWDPMEPWGGPQLQPRAVPPFLPEQLPQEESLLTTTILPPQVVGLGYLEAVSEQTILALADNPLAREWGIQGKPHYIEISLDLLELLIGERVTSPVTSPVIKVLGRFGRKASSFNLLHQTAKAYIQDIGITNPIFPVENLSPQASVHTGDEISDPEISMDTLLVVVFYLRTLEAPPRRNTHDPDVQEGERIFGRIGCSFCHVPELKTGPSPIRSLSEVTIHPYTDLLLHDMGERLDDGYREGEAGGSYWRTGPLWGLGLSSTSTGGKGFYLHDGRARTVEEAILYHGGEAERSRQAYESLDLKAKRKLLKFLDSL